MSASRLLGWLTLFALLVAPLGMIGGSPAMAHERAAAAGPCDDMGSPDETSPAAPADCMIACAGLPAQGSAVALRPIFAAVSQALPEPSHLAGLQPEAATPPPRSS